MKSLTIGISIIVASLLAPTAASGITFGEWATAQGYSPGAVMPDNVEAFSAGIDSLSGIDAYNWTATPTEDLWLFENQISSIEPGDFVGLTKLRLLYLDFNQLTSIEPDDFRGLTSLEVLGLWGNQIASIDPGDFSELTNLTELILDYNQLTSIEASDFSGLTGLTYLWLGGNQLSSIEAATFSGLTNLRWLALDDTHLSSIEASDFSGLMNLETLQLYSNQLSSIEADDFCQLSNLRNLWLEDNPLTTIEKGAFSSLTNLEWLFLGNNPTLTELNLAEADFSSLTDFDVAGNVNLTRVSLERAVMNQTSLAALMDGGINPNIDWTGVGELGGITELDLSGIDFASITDLAPLYVMDDLTDLWLIDTVNLVASDLDVLLDNLDTIEGTSTEGVLHLTQANYDAFNLAGGDLLAAWHGEPGHHVELILPGDYNDDGIVDAADFTVWRDNLGAPGDMIPNHNDLGPIGTAHYLTWKSHFGMSAPTSLSDTRVAGVPEPATVLLVLVAILVAPWLKRAACRIPSTR